MALKVLMLRKKLDEKQKALADLRETAKGFEKREADLEQSIEEAETDEEKSAVEEEVEKFETDKEANDKASSDLEAEIEQIESQINELERSAPKPNQTRGTSGEEKREKGETRMKTRVKLWNKLPIEQRSAILADETVKHFLERTRSFIGQQRAVTGAELTIPDVLLDLMRDNLDQYSKLIGKVRLKPIKGHARQNIAGTIPEGVWTEAIAVLNELTIAFNQVEVDGYMVGGFIPVPNATLQDSDENLAAEIMEALAQAIGLAVDKAILYGTGVKMLFGIMTRLAQTAKPSSWPTYAPTWVDLHTTNIMKFDGSALAGAAFFEALILKLGVAKANYSSGEKFWCMNSTTKATILAKSLAFNAAGAIVAGMSNQMPVIGGEIIELDFMSDGDIVGGYGDLYLLAEREGSEFAVSEHFRFVQNQTVFRGLARYDGLPVIAAGFVAVNIKNTDPTTVVAFAGDTANPADAYLSTLTVGSKTLSPTFSSTVETYTCATTDATNTITATAAKTGAVITIMNGETPVVNGQAATWDAGENTLTVSVKYGTTEKTYTVTVTKS